jgi:hypothetical protein
MSPSERPGTPGGHRGRYEETKRLALVECLVHTARRARDDLAEMLCKRVDRCKSLPESLRTAILRRVSRHDS